MSKLKSLVKLKLKSLVMVKAFSIKLKRKRCRIQNQKVEERVYKIVLNKFWNNNNSYFSKGFCPILGLQSYRQHSALIPSVEVPTFNKVEIHVFTMLVPGSIASIHS